MDKYLSPTLKNNTGKEVSLEELTQTPIIGLYFSASWCPPCQTFTKLLIPFYETVNEESKQFEVVLFPYDKEEEAAKAYFGKMPWLSVPLGHEKVKASADHFKVHGIPAFFILKSDGTVLSTDGRKDVSTLGEKALEKWRKTALESK